MGRGAILVLVGDPSSDGVIIKLPLWGRCLLDQPASHLIFS